MNLAVLNKLCELIFNAKVDLQPKSPTKKRMTKKVVDDTNNKVNITVFDNGTTAWQVGGD
jgi:hypothetical protein